MKNLIAAILVFVSFNAFGQGNFNGDWFNSNDASYILHIDIYNNEVYEHGLKDKDTLYEKLIFIDDKKIITEMYLKERVIDTYEYKIVKNTLKAISLSTKTTTTYKKQKL